ncbi:MAG TPA: histidine kinase [Opitutaceae bacterium]|nr:histidine kinase [Opitutaceae bacterium]
MMEYSADISLPAGDAVQREQARARLYVLLQAGGWGTLMAIETWAIIAFPEHEASWGRGTTLAVNFTSFATGLLITHFMRPLMERWNWKELGWRALLPRLFAMALAGSAVWNAAEVIWVHGVLGLPWRYQYSVPTILVMQECSFGSILFSWLCLYYFYHVFERLNRSEVERFRLMTSVKEAELRALKSQVNPHFIFNSLNSLRALIDEDPARARKAVTQLANLLRYSLQSGQLETVPFEDELDIVNDYLALEQVRHEERLRLRLDIAPEALQMRIPPMLLQTLVENAVKYGISPRPDGGEIAIVARSSGGALRIQVSNPGQIESGGRVSSTGVGLRNAAERLRLIFGERATLQLRSDREPAHVVAEAVIPLPTH